jgi:acyl carrier protein
MSQEIIDNILKDYTEVEFTPESNLFSDLHLDSLDIVELCMALEDAYKIHIPDDAFEFVSTVQDLYNLDVSSFERMS